MPHTYSISYDYAGGKLPDGKANPNGYTYFESAFSLVNPQKEGYDFVGWTGTDLPSAQQEVIIPAQSRGDKAFTAVYSPREARIAFDTKAKDITVSDRIGKTDETVSDRTLPKLSSHNGYGFGGWYDKDGNKITKLPARFPAGTTTYTARWNYIPLTSDPNIQVEVPEISSDGTGVTASNETITKAAKQAKTMLQEIAAGKVPTGMSAQDAEKIKNLIDTAGENDTIVTIISLQAEKKEQLSDTEQNQLDDVKQKGEVSAACFDISVSISVQVEKTDGSIEQVEHISLSMLEAPLLFDLYLSPSSIQEKAVRVAHIHNKELEVITPESTDRENGIVKIYAQKFSPYVVLASQNVIVTFESNGGTKIEPQTVRFGKTVAKPKNPVRKGYTFKGWFSDINLKEPYNFNTKAENSFTLYAKWSKKEKTKTTDSGHQNTGAGRHSKPVKAGDPADLRLWPAVLLASAVFILILRKKLR